MRPDTGAGGRHAPAFAPGNVEIQQYVPRRLAEQVGGEQAASTPPRGVEFAGE
jgi:hypothetical protein